MSNKFNANFLERLASQPLDITPRKMWPVWRRGALLLFLVGLLGNCSSETKVELPVRADLVVAGPGKVAEVVRSAAMDAKHSGRDLVVYVGAKWCEPCKVFMHALKSGGLPQGLAKLRILKFDSDVDEERLEAARYGGRMIPRFVRPLADGTGSGKRFEGSVKGAQAVDNIVPRLQELLR